MKRVSAPPGGPKACLRRWGDKQMTLTGSASRAALGIALAGGLLLSAGTAVARTVVEEVLDILREEGRISEARYEDLMERHRAEQAQAALPAVAAPAENEKDPEGWSVGWKNAIRIERNDGYHKLAIGGRIMNDWAVIHQDASLVNADSTWITGTEFRNARIYMEGTLFERLIFKAEYDFAGGDPAFTDVFIGLLNLGPIDTTRVGHYKEPFSLEEQTSRRFITFMERSLANVFSPARNTGAGVQSAPLEGRMTWAVGGFSQTDAFGDGFGSAGNYDLTARFTGLPVYGDEGRTLVHLGLGYSHQFRDTATPVTYSQRPEMHMADSLLDTGAIPEVQNVDLFGPEFAWVWGPFSLQSELIGASVQRGLSLPDLWLWGAYVEGSYWITGENRQYNTARAAFDRVTPAHSFDPGEGSWGAFQVAARYSYLDLDDADIQGGQEDDLTLGLNWHLYSNARVMFNYVHGWVRDQGDVNGGQTRFQIDF